MNLVSYSDSETQQCEDVEGAKIRLLCCRGVVVNDGRQQAEHHVLNLRGDGSFYGRRRSQPDRQRVAAVIPCLTMGRFPGSTTFAALGGTTLCCVGGDSPDLFLFDATKHDELWRKGPSMLEHRVCPRVVAIDSKLFVFGGCSATSHRASWAEVYDTCTDEWTYLPPLPPHLMPPTGTNRKSFFAAAITVGGDHGSKQIVVGGWGQMFCTYEMSTHTWACPHFDSGINPELISYFKPDSVAIGSTLYCFSRSESCFLAYDFESQTIFGGALSGQGAKKCLDAWTSSLCDGLLVLPDDGDDGSVHLLFVWSQEMLRFLPSSSSDPSSPATHTYLHCTRVRVSKVTSSWNILSGYLDASIVSSWSLSIAHSFQLQDALFMDVVEGLEELSPYGKGVDNA